MLEKNISSDSEWLVTSNISIADVAIWRLLGWLSSGILDGMPTDLLSGFPKIRKLCLAVDKHPKIQKSKNGYRSHIPIITRVETIKTPINSI
jgi:glutathione S-transferase